QEHRPLHGIAAVSIRCGLRFNGEGRPRLCRSAARRPCRAGHSPRRGAMARWPHRRGGKADDLTRRVLASIDMPALPVAEALPRLLAALEEGAAAVLVAPPGAGKTTLVPLALLDAPWRG